MCKIIEDLEFLHFVSLYFLISLNNGNFYRKKSGCLIVTCFYLGSVTHSWRYQLRGQGLLGSRLCSSSGPNTNSFVTLLGKSSTMVPS